MTPVTTSPVVYPIMASGKFKKKLISPADISKTRQLIERHTSIHEVRTGDIHWLPTPNIYHIFMAQISGVS